MMYSTNSYPAGLLHDDKLGLAPNGYQVSHHLKLTRTPNGTTPLVNSLTAEYLREVQNFDQVTADIVKHSYSCGFFQKKAELTWQLKDGHEEASRVVHSENPTAAVPEGNESADDLMSGDATGQTTVTSIPDDPNLQHYTYQLAEENSIALMTGNGNGWLSKNFRLTLDWWLDDNSLRKWTAQLQITLADPDNQKPAQSGDGDASTWPLGYYPRKIHSAVLRVGDQEAEIADVPLYDEENSHPKESARTQNKSPEQATITLQFRKDDVSFFRNLTANTIRSAFKLDQHSAITCALVAKSRPSDLLERPIQRVCYALVPKTEGLSHITQLTTLFTDPLTGNYSVKTGSDLFHVDKSALNRTSPVFRALFNHGETDKSNDETPYEFLNISPEAVKTFLVFCYLKATPDLDKCAADVAILADMLQVPELVGRAEFFLIRTALQLRTPSEVVSLAELAVALSLKKLLLVLHFVSHERLGVWNRQEINAWTEFLEKEPRFSLGYAKGIKDILWSDEDPDVQQPPRKRQCV
ncbi:uncharacterized protein LOC129586722 [Paramacrobiotus metropolitanus]|uniref:uncharacterized protein LOC129586722 n=1 Tax=Paramacrobiotus metropolitanus TaxID=2943436 RepID=UPI00244653DB|nr:uncharacterized protein LOC129586722 [Paramacrobiotus metropolitanus]